MNRILTNGYLLDTNIISRIAPGKQEPHQAVKVWFHEQGEAGKLFLSAMTVAEIEKGMRSLHRRGGVDRASLLNDWLTSLTENFADRILPMDVPVARIAGAIDDMASSRGYSPGLADTIIAATAKAYDLTVVTANLKHFEPLAVSVELPETFRASN